MSWIEPVFDRKLSDTIYGNPKGCVDANVLNRIEGNVHYLMEKFTSSHIPYGIDYVPELRIWDRTKYIRVGIFNDIKHNITYIRDSGFRYTDTPTLIDSIAYKGVTITELNDMEQILFEAKQLYDGSRIMGRIEGTFTLGSNYQRQYVRSVY